MCGREQPPGLTTRSVAAGTSLTGRQGARGEPPGCRCSWGKPQLILSLHSCGKGAFKGTDHGITAVGGQVLVATFAIGAQF